MYNFAILKTQNCLKLQRKHIFEQILFSAAESQFRASRKVRIRALPKRSYFDALCNLMLYFSDFCDKIIEGVNGTHNSFQRRQWQSSSHNKAKSENSILTFAKKKKKIQRVRKMIRTRFFLLETKSHRKAKGKNSILTFQQTNKQKQIKNKTKQNKTNMVW